MNTININRIDASRRQIDTAIRLYFEDTDVVSTHALVCAAHELLIKLGEKQGIKSYLMDKLVGMAYENKKRILRKKLNEAKNFFKHAHPQPEKILKFKPDFTEFWLWDSCSMYEKLCSKATKYMRVFTIWFYMRHENILMLNEHKKIVRELKSYNKDKYDFFVSTLDLLSKIEKDNL